jgi:hypothetical protein
MLKKTLTATLFVALLSSLAFGYQQGAGWEKFNSPEGRFNILMPAKPEQKVKEVDSPVGKQTLYTYSVLNNTGYFGVTYGDYPVEPNSAAQKETVLDRITKSLAARGAEMIGEKKITLAGHPGREFTVDKNIQGTDVVYNWRIYLVGQRLYQLAVVTPKANAGSPDVAKFLTSFELSK